MSDVVIVEAVRTPFGRRGGGLSQAQSGEVLADTLRTLIDRSGVDPSVVGQVIGGCVGQVGMQTSNVTRTGWLMAGLPISTAATTVDAQCGSSQQAASLTYALVKSGVIDAGVACGVELMSRVPMGSTVPKDGSLGKAITRRYWEHHEFTTQFEGAERLADQWGISRADTDGFAKQSQDRAARAQSEGRFDTQLVPIKVADLGEDGKPTGTFHTVTKDEGVRATTLEGLGNLKPSGRPDGVHTAGSSSQISDGASAVMMMTAEKAKQLGLKPLATIVDSILVGSDPVLMLTGPIVATNRLFETNGVKMSDIDVVEINEAFASVVLAWQKEFGPDMEKVNPNGGAIALGHPLGATGTALLTKAVHELIRTDGEQALVTMCCGGGLGTGTLLRRG